MTLNHLNHYTCNYTPPSVPSSYLALGTQYGAWWGTGILDHVKSDVYINQASKVTTLTSAISNIYWYPPVANATASNCSIYEILIESKAYSASSFGTYPLVSIGTTHDDDFIVYNKTPQTEAVNALTVTANVTETGTYTGILANYGKYIETLSKLNLTASGSSTFGYGTSVTNVIRLNEFSPKNNREIKN